MNGIKLLTPTQPEFAEVNELVVYETPVSGRCMRAAA
ncbi:hypothetical protein F441_04191, partial [Phytophthora nicotianae CJ01A1]|uniref:Uncharacterized protein n=6 Tax=Phytophthora nicotianae TaxID=4792 RepID=W2LR42_PHYNI